MIVRLLLSRIVRTYLVIAIDRLIDLILPYNRLDSQL